MFALSPEELSALKLSLLVATAATIASLPFGILFGYVLARKDFRGKSILEMVINFSLVVPPVVVGYVLLLALGRRGFIGGWFYRTFDLSIAFTLVAAIIASAVVSFPLMVRSIRLAFQAVDKRLELAARTLGASKWNTFRTVSLPLARDGLIAGCVLAFARSLGEFGATIVFAGNIIGKTQTIPVAIFSLAERPGGLSEAWRLAVISLMIAGLAIFISEYLDQRGRRRLGETA